MEEAEIYIEGLALNRDVLDHIAEHDVVESDLHEVRLNAPQYFINPPAADRSATHVIIGPNLEGRFLFIAISETEKEGTYWVHTAHWFHARLALKHYKR